ncbi:MAG: hypothetical protein A2X46_08125 [Lentisphaerae bacterium GWF2_57_35]|nr:MAG: hypothetical protein A2X46_08125 [Lentisphaerae bacterium GWF2_57_35]
MDRSRQEWAFVHHQMSEEELRAFLQGLENDPQLRNEVEQIHAVDHQLQLLANISRLSKEELELIRKGFLGEQEWLSNPLVFAKELEKIWNRYGANQLVIQTEQAGEVEVVHLGGTLDTINAESFSNLLQPLCDAGRRMVVDCMGLTYVNSLCLSLWNKFHMDCEARGGKLVFCCLPQKINRIVLMLGLNEVLKIEATVSAALRIASE